MFAKEEQEKPLKWFILPNESYKWDFILEKCVIENSQQEVVPDSVGTKQPVDDGFEKDYIVTKKSENDEIATTIERQSNIDFSSTFFIIWGQKRIGRQRFLRLNS